MSTMRRQRMHEDLQLAGLAEGYRSFTSASPGNRPGRWHQRMKQRVFSDMSRSSKATER